MKHTDNLDVLRDFLDRNVPHEQNFGKVTAYVQDCLNHYDYYILFWNPGCDYFFALVDSLPDKYTLELDTVPISFLDGATLFYKRIPLKKQVRWITIYKKLIPIKNGYPGFLDV